MIHPFDSMRRWWKSGGPTASVDTDSSVKANGNGGRLENLPKPVPEPAWLAQLDKHGLFAQTLLHLR